jgi:hypothetical protein
LEAFREDHVLERRVFTMDTIIRTVDLLSFLVLIVSWLVLPARGPAELVADVATHGV